MGHKRWTKEDEELLMKWYGSYPIDKIAKRLDRTVGSIINKRQRMKLGAFLDNGDYITLNQLVKAVKGRDSADGYVKTSRGMMYRMYKTENQDKIRAIVREEQGRA